LDSRQVKFP